VSALGDHKGSPLLISSKSKKAPFSKSAFAQIIRNADLDFFRLVLENASVSIRETS
jgi:hypothetical protein